MHKVAIRLVKDYWGRHEKLADGLGDAFVNLESGFI